MSQNVTQNPLPRRQEEAALLSADDALTDAEIAAKVGITERTLYRWRKDAAFADRVASHRHELAEQVRRQGIATKQNRLDSYVADFAALDTIIAERGEHADFQDVPGGKTGFLARDLKMIGGGDNAKEVETFAVDTGLIAARLNLRRQIAQELGEWTDKQELSGSLRREYVLVRDDAPPVEGET